MEKKKEKPAIPSMELYYERFTIESDCNEKRKSRPVVRHILHLADTV